MCVCMCVFPEYSEARQRREVQPSSLSYYKTTNCARHGQKSPLLGPHQQNPNSPKKNPPKLESKGSGRHAGKAAFRQQGRSASHLLALGRAGTSTDGQKWKMLRIREGTVPCADDNDGFITCRTPLMQLCWFRCWFKACNCYRRSL